MKILIALLVLAATVFGQGVSNPPGPPTCSATVTANCVIKTDAAGNASMDTTILGPRTIGAGAKQLPAAASCVRCMTVVTDAASTSDCTVGSGTAHAVCYSDGATWGPLGSSGVSGTFLARGAYAAGTTYAALDLVSSGGITYVSVADANTGNTPASSPTWWATAGPAGPTGAKGDKGDTGDTGATGPGYLATSNTIQTIASSGSLAFLTQAGLAYSVGARMRATCAAGPAAGGYVEGVVTEYAAGITITADRSSGSGDCSDWKLNLAGDVGATGAAGATGAQGSQGIAGASPIITISTSGPVTVTDAGFYFNNASGALTYNLPTISAPTVGYRFCFNNSPTKTGAITLQLPASTYLANAGANGSAAGTFVSGGALGDAACVVAVDTTHYQAYVGAGTWTNN